MSQQDDSENTYQVDPEHSSELTRLIRQSRFMTHALGGLFPDHPILPASRVLDLACGPGDWALDLASSHRDEGIEVIGVDISKLMTGYAQAQAEAAGLTNARFLVSNIMKPLTFPDHYFDIINARFMTFMPASAWHPLLQECYRVLKPGGVIRLVEAEVAFGNSPAYEKLTQLIVKALNQAGQGFSPGGYYLGITAMLRSLLESNGFQEVRERANIINYSFGQPAHEFQYQNYMVGSTLILPFLLKHEMTTPTEFEEICKQLQGEMLDRSFSSVSFITTAWGHKPV